MLVGGGEDMPRFQTMACGLGIEDSVIFTGSVSDSAPYMSAMDMVLMPSHYEGMPLTLVEEQANGSARRCLRHHNPQRKPYRQPHISVSR